MNAVLKPIALFIFTSFLVMAVNNVDKNEIIITGPGLHPDEIVMPARYFFVYLNGTHELRYDPQTGNDIQVDINGENIYEKNCRVWTNVLDRRDGSYIVRYKLYQTCYNMEINVKYKGEHVGGSPFKMNGTVQAEDCYCPTSLDEWMQKNDCPTSYPQIDEDLQAFPSVNLSTFHSQLIDRFDHSGSMSVCNYVIIQNNVHRSCYGQHVGFKIFFDAILTSLARKMRLPDCELFVNLGDWPLSLRVGKEFPIFSWCGSKNTLDIVLPTYDITESSLESMGRVSLDMLSVQGNVELPWQDRESKAFWRGRDASRERLKLIEIARKHPDLLNASLTNFFFFRDQEQQYGPKEKHMSFFKFFDFKYQVNLDGTVAPYRTPYLLAGGSLMLKQDSEYYEHFYNSLVPWKHYVPVKRDLSDLVERVRWAQDHDQEARDIASAAQQFARDNLLPQHVFCYHTVLLKEWSRRLVEPVQVREGMEQVPQTENKECSCESPAGARHNEL